MRQTAETPRLEFGRVYALQQPTSFREIVGALSARYNRACIVGADLSLTSPSIAPTSARSTAELVR